MTHHHPSTLSILLPLLLITACDDDGSDDTAAGSGTTMTTPDPTTGIPSASTGPGSTDDGSTGTPTDPTGDRSTGATTGSTGMASGDSTGEAGLEIAGEWIEMFAPGDAIMHIIDPHTWEQLAPFGDALFHIDSYDNAGRFVVAQGDAANDFFPELYSKFNWTWDGDDLYYCTVVFDAATAAEALAVPDADPGDLDAGCGGFGWSPLMPAP